MRCEQCGRVLKNAQMWLLSGDQSAPMSRSMRLLCWDCRETDGDLKPAPQDESNSILAQAYAIVQEVESRGF